MISDDQLGEPVDLRPMFDRERQELVELLAGLGHADWSASTVCPGWSVADIVAHLWGDDLGRLSGGRDAHVHGGPVDGASLAEFLDRRNEEWVVACRPLSQPVLVDLLHHTGEQVARWWLTLDPASPSIGVSWAGVDPAPVWFDAARDATEYWLHEQQIREAVGAPLRNDRATVRRMLDVLARGLPAALAAVSADDDAVGLVRTTGVLTQRWVLRRGGGRWWFLGDEPDVGPPQLAAGMAVAWEVVVDADDLWRRWIRHPAAARLHVRTGGDVATATAVIDHVAIVRSPGS